MGCVQSRTYVRYDENVCIETFCSISFIRPLFFALFFMNLPSTKKPNSKTNYADQDRSWFGRLVSTQPLRSLQSTIGFILQKWYKSGLYHWINCASVPLRVFVCLPNQTIVIVDKFRKITFKEQIMKAYEASAVAALQFIWGGVTHRSSKSGETLLDTCSREHWDRVEISKFKFVIGYLHLFSVSLLRSSAVSTNTNKEKWCKHVINHISAIISWCAENISIHSMVAHFRSWQC